MSEGLVIKAVLIDELPHVPVQFLLQTTPPNFWKHDKSFHSPDVALYIETQSSIRPALKLKI